MVISKNNFKKNLLLTFCWVGIFLLFSQAICAKTLEEYKQNVGRLKDDFAAMTIDEGFESETEVLEKVPNLLPAEEKIEVGGASIDINNKWLSEEIKKYKAQTDVQEKLLIVTAIYERLAAIELKIVELENAISTKRSKDQEKQKLAEILKREEYQKPVEEGESLLQRFFKWIDDWLRKFAPVNEQQPQSSSDFGTVAYVLQILLYVLIIGVIGFLIYKFSPFFIRKYRERERGEKHDRIILGEKIAADETSANLFSEAEKLAREGNLRDAIRKGYIAFLFELSERRLIGLAKHKTNRDYLRAVRKKRELYKNMNGLTLNYERHWYGFENADETDWEEFRDNYKEALNKG